MKNGGTETISGILLVKTIIFPLNIVRVQSWVQRLTVICLSIQFEPTEVSYLAPLITEKTVTGTKYDTFLVFLTVGLNICGYLKSTWVPFNLLHHERITQWGKNLKRYVKCGWCDMNCSYTWVSSNLVKCI